VTCVQQVLIIITCARYAIRRQIVVVMLCREICATNTEPLQTSVLPSPVPSCSNDWWMWNGWPRLLHGSKLSV